MLEIQHEPHSRDRTGRSGSVFYHAECLVPEICSTHFAIQPFNQCLLTNNQLLTSRRLLCVTKRIHRVRKVRLCAERLRMRAEMVETVA